ncbi:hypothetical protein QJS04_geneDACA009709 [Acorus gramineus]|uniref:N-acetyltransferase domain-containing protein n=1 Tax=Acorus gramineus TaxID=55184 RepID=A0AAV9B9F3_ACOGR|nr:hypothetical protein QJS04_geneDACA009709 [Acorus gramineus]
MTLRPFKLTDIDDFMAWVTDDRVSALTHWDTCTTKEEALNYLTKTIIPHPWFMAICLNGKPVGSIFVMPCRAEVGYALAFKYWGRGIVTRAMKMVVHLAFEEWPQLERIEALVALENVSSQRVLEKAGFFKEGVLVRYCNMKGKTWDMVMYSYVPNYPRV